MTTREFFNSIINHEITDEVLQFAEDGLAKLDAKNAKRASTPSKTAIANEPIKAQIADLVADKGTCTASDISADLGISTQKASALAKQLVEAGTLKVEDIKVPKKGTVKAYSLA